jgi:hypothetical protein
MSLNLQKEAAIDDWRRRARSRPVEGCVFCHLIIRHYLKKLEDV